MPRHVAFLRGVTPTNLRMPDLKRAFEAAGFADVRTLLSSGNVAFTAPTLSTDALARRIERTLAAELGRDFDTIVRATRHLLDLLESDPFAPFDLPPEAKPVITFLRRPPATPIELPVERDGARILSIVGSEVFTAYVPNAKGPVFMNLLERTFGAEITTRTVATVRKCAQA